MKITKDFIGGNIEVLSQDGDEVFLEREMRDSAGDWFYWAFCVSGAAGRTVTFRFPGGRFGTMGAAVSRDLRAWRWLGETGDSFTYHFEDDGRVYFSQHMLYDTTRLSDLLAERGIPFETLCRSQGGRDVPCLRLGGGDRSVVLTARHHACESTGSYVLEGFLRGYFDDPIPGYELFVVPYVDYDGVLAGDQGKNRIPHDHNRDYDPDIPSIYPVCGAIRDYADTHAVEYGFDFHSPWLRGEQNDEVFIVQKSHEKLAELAAFGKTLEEHISGESLQYYSKNDFPPDVAWNSVASPTCSSYLMRGRENRLAFSLETTYSGTRDNVFTPKRAVSLGRDFYRATLDFIRKEGTENE